MSPSKDSRPCRQDAVDLVNALDQCETGGDRIISLQANLTVWYARGRAESTAVSDAQTVPLVLYCPAGHQHIDDGEWTTKPHKTHRCQYEVWRGGEMKKGPCGLEWRPANFPTVGVAALGAEDAN